MVSFIALAALAQAPRSASLAAHLAALKDAQSLTAVYKVQEVGGASRDYSLTLQKPDKARIDTPETVFVADGKTITVFVKSENAYYKKDETKQALLDAFSGMDLALYAPFFDGGALQLSNVKEGPLDRGMKTAKASIPGGGEIQIFFDPASKLARQAAINTRVKGQDRRQVLNGRSFSMTADASAFGFTAPTGSRETTEDELMGVKWLSYSEAMAKANGQKLVMIDFGAEWCHFCKQMEREVFTTREFKDAVKGMILAKVDTDKEPALGQQFNVSSLPTVKFVLGDKVVHEFVGYGGKDEVLGEIKSARRAAGI